MEFKENKIKPDSAKTVLRQQVESQSRLCDFTITKGYWSRRFHRCVLVGSPFFQCLLEHDFVEKNIGSVEIGIGSPSTIDASIMFLYGKRPKIDINNVIHLLDLAEYLLIPNLKALCVKWLRDVEVTEENVITVLHLSSLYGFDVNHCYDYIRKHLIECFDMEGFLTVTEESLSNLFTDETLMYVSADLKFQFLVKWAKHHGECSYVRAIQRMFKLLPSIDIGEIHPSIFEAVHEDPFFRGININFAEDSLNANSLKEHIVLALKPYLESAEYWVFDTVRNAWLRVDCQSQHVIDFSKCISSKYVGGSIIYRVKNNYHSLSVFLHDLEKDQVVEIMVDLSDTCAAVAIGSDTIFLTMERFVTKSNRLDNNPLFLSRLKSSRSIPSKRVTVLHMGLVNADSEEIEINPILSLPFEVDKQVCANRVKTVAFLSNNRTEIFLYDANRYQMDRLLVSGTYGDRLRATDDGFVLFNNKRTICILPSQSPLLKERYRILEIELNKETDEHTVKKFKYYFVEKLWIRHFYTYSSEEVLEYTFHENLLKSESVDKVTWTAMPLMEDWRSHGLLDNAVLISLSKYRLRCHLKCPHCERGKQEQWDQRLRMQDRSDQNSPVYYRTDDRDYDVGVYFGDRAVYHYDDYSDDDYNYIFD